MLLIAVDGTVLLEAPFDPARRQKNSVLLAIDLTTAVADEAIRRQDSAIVAYRKRWQYPLPMDPDAPIQCFHWPPDTV